MRRLAALAAVLALAACSPSSLKGVNTETLDAAVSKAIGDPSTCVLLAEAGSGRIVHQYNSHAACRVKWPSCEGPGLRNARELAELTAKDRQTRTLSCNTRDDASRGVAWAAGPIAGRPLVYAAVMEGDRVFPGRMMADRLARAFQKAGL